MVSRALVFAVSGTILSGSCALAAASAAAHGTGPSANQVRPSLRYVTSQRRTTTTRRSGWMSPQARTGSHLIYWGDANNGVVNIFPARGINRKPIGQIAGVLESPGRLFVDKHLNLYVADQGTSTVLVYPPGATSPSLTISDGIVVPTGLAVDTSGTLYVANILYETITEYPAGQTSPSTTLQLSIYPENIALDRKGNLYVVHANSSGGGDIFFIPHGKTTGSDLGLHIESPSDVRVDYSGNLIVADTGAHTIDIFPPGAKDPSKVIPVNPGAPADLALNRTETELYVTVAMPSYQYVVQKFAYPDGTALQNKIAKEYGQFAIAVSPDTVR